ncbi:MAG: hypothetical protein HQ463_05200 [Bacteroidetes bacterium]|nr:hypothetical protein [Bacteroidota bacterium]
MKFNKILSGILSLYLCVSILSCTQKGNDDPAISFRTRKQRVIGEWIVVSSYGNSVNQFLPGEGEDDKFDTDGNDTYTRLVV